MTFFSTLFFTLGELLATVGEFFSADRGDSNKSQKNDSELWEAIESERIRYEILAAVERMERAERTRPAKSRALEGELVEVWMP